MRLILILANAILLIGGTDDHTTQFVYGISNDQTSSITAAEINLMGTVTTDITNGIQGLTLDNFVFLKFKTTTNLIC